MYDWLSVDRLFQWRTLPDNLNTNSVYKQCDLLFPDIRYNRGCVYQTLGDAERNVDRFEHYTILLYNPPGLLFYLETIPQQISSLIN